MFESSLLCRVIHSVLNPGIKVRVTEVTNGLLSIETLSLGFSDYFTSDDYADLANSIKFRVESTSVALVGVYCCAESYGGGVYLMFY